MPKSFIPTFIQSPKILAEHLKWRLDLFVHARFITCVILPLNKGVLLGPVILKTCDTYLKWSLVNASLIDLSSPSDATSLGPRRFLRFSIHDGYARGWARPYHNDTLVAST